MARIVIDGRYYKGIWKDSVVYAEGEKDAPELTEKDAELVVSYLKNIGIKAVIKEV